MQKTVLLNKKQIEITRLFQKHNVVILFILKNAKLERDSN